MPNLEGKMTQKNALGENALGENARRLWQEPSGAPLA
jgi:hypothetical protein